MNYREIKLASGKIVAIEKFEMSFTYDGLLLGSPNKEMNDRTISDIKKSYGNGRLLMLLDDAYVSEKLLKPIIFSAQLISDPIKKTKDNSDGSYLNLVWFGDDFKSNTIEKIIMGLKDFNWNNEAENYQF
jgi:hypothetical protein